MVKLMIKSKVKDFNAWQKVFMESEDFRMKAGAKSAQVFRGADDMNSIIVILDWDDPEKAKAWSQSQELRDLQQKAGVVGKPEAYVLQTAPVGEMDKM
jgi:heme-degrading monooxygenase HmoA